MKHSGPEVADLLSRSYRGEIRGHSLFAALIDHFEPAIAAKLTVLAELEREMATALGPVLERFGVDVGDVSGEVQPGARSRDL